MRELHGTVACGQAHKGIFACCGIVVALYRWGCRAKQCSCSKERCKNDACIACVVAWGWLLLFIAVLVFFVHNDKSQSLEWQEHGRAYSKDYVVGGIAKLLFPNLYPFGIGKLGVVQAYAVAEYTAESFHNLFGKRNFGQHIEHLLSAFKCFGDKVYVNLGLAGRSDTMQQCHAFFAECLLYLVKRLLLCMAKRIDRHTWCIAVVEASNLHIVAFKYTLVLKLLIYWCCDLCHFQKPVLRYLLGSFAEWHGYLQVGCQ